MAEVIPLPVYPGKPTGHVLDEIRKAKAGVNTSILFKPVRAVPGSPGKILAFERPNFACDYALVKPVASEIKPALEWILGINNNFKGYSSIVLLREIFGPDVVEVEDEQTL